MQPEDGKSFQESLEDSDLPDQRTRYQTETVQQVCGSLGRQEPAGGMTKKALPTLSKTCGVPVAGFS